MRRDVRSRTVGDVLKELSLFWSFAGLLPPPALRTKKNRPVLPSWIVLEVVEFRRPVVQSRRHEKTIWAAAAVTQLLHTVGDALEKLSSFDLTPDFPVDRELPPAPRMGAPALLNLLELYWRSSNSDKLWYKSGDTNRRIASTLRAGGSGWCVDCVFRLSPRRVRRSRSAEL